MLPREAYYEAMRDLGIARDLLQMQIGVFLASVKETRGTLRRHAPGFVARFDAVEDLTTQHLADDLTGGRPDEQDR